MKISLVSLASLTLTLAITATSLTGCSGDDGVNGKDGIDGTDGVNGKNGTDGKDAAPACSPPDPTFWLVLRDFEEAERYYDTCRAESDGQHALCIASSKPEDFYCKEAGSCLAYCQKANDQREDNCNRFTAWRANKTTVRLCKAEVLHYTAPTPDQPYGSLGGVTTEDTDGDGLTNFEEYQLLLNPCSKTSYGSCTKDAELDGDFDGEPNGTDAMPYCNLQDPENVSDCILQSHETPSFFPTPTPSRLLNHDPPAGESGTAWMTAPHLSIARVAFRIFRLLLTCIQPLCKNLAMNTSRQNLIIVNLFITLQREKS